MGPRDGYTPREMDYMARAREDVQWQCASIIATTTANTWRSGDSEPLNPMRFHPDYESGRFTPEPRIATVDDLRRMAPAFQALAELKELDNGR